MAIREYLREWGSEIKVRKKVKRIVFWNIATEDNINKGITTYIEKDFISHVINIPGDIEVDNETRDNYTHGGENFVY